MQIGTTLMNVNLPHYLTGEEVHAGDRVRYKGTAASVVFVSDGEEGEFSSGFEEYSGHDAGIMIRDDDEQLTFLTEPSEDLELVRDISSSMWS